MSASEDCVSEYPEMRHRLPPRENTWHRQAGRRFNPEQLRECWMLVEVHIGWAWGRQADHACNGTYLSRPYRVDVIPDAACSPG